MSQEIRTVVAEGPSESAVRRRCVPEMRTRERMRFASVSSEVMEEGSTGPARSGGEGRKTKKRFKAS